MAEDLPARARIHIGRNLSLLLRDPGHGPWDYPACRIQEGLVLACGNEELAEEGLGFGVPLLKFGRETVFPGAATVIGARLLGDADGNALIVQASYELNLVQRIALRNGRSIHRASLYRLVEYFSWLHRKYPSMRGLLTWASHYLRLNCGIEITFESVTNVGTAKVVYAIDANEGRIQASVDLSEVRKRGCTEVIVANEQGASYFDQYLDSDGVTLAGNAIGTWDETFAREATLIDSRDDVAFKLQRVTGARMFRGRELVSDRLAWSGLNYVIPPATVHFAYAIRIGAHR